MQLALCGVTDWNDVPEKDETSVTSNLYCNKLWHDTKVIHICSESYLTHANARHVCECGELGEL